jgi:hypothetical protein
VVSAVVALAATQAAAQEVTVPPDTAEKPGIELLAFVGGNVPLVHLNEDPSARFRPGFSGGVGLMYDIEKLLALRADVSFAKSNISHGDLGAALNSDSWNRIMTGFDMVVRINLLKPVTTYFTVGFGVIRFSESGGRTPVRGAGRLGGGFRYPVGSKLNLFGQAQGWMYHFDSTRFAYFNKAQFDLTISTGVSARF